MRADVIAQRIRPWLATRSALCSLYLLLLVVAAPNSLHQPSALHYHPLSFSTPRAGAGLDYRELHAALRKPSFLPSDLPPDSAEKASRLSTGEAEGAQGGGEPRRDEDVLNQSISAASSSTPAAPAGPLKTGGAARLERLSKESQSGTSRPPATPATAKGGHAADGSSSKKGRSGRMEQGTILTGWATLKKEGRRLVTSRMRVEPWVKQRAALLWRTQQQNDKHNLGLGAEDAMLDPTGVGFACGGVYPGMLHSKGSLHDAHKVHAQIRLLMPRITH